MKNNHVKKELLNLKKMQYQNCVKSELNVLGKTIECVIKNLLLFLFPVYVSKGSSA